MNRIVKLALALISVFIILLVIFSISVIQAKEEVPQRCQLFDGICADDCNGINFKEPDLKRADCEQGKICCLG